MNKLDSHPPVAYQTTAQSLASPFPNIPASTALGTGRRLIVLFPADTEPSAASRRIWELAHATGMQVLLVSLFREADEEPALRRRLVTMASLVQDGRRSVEIKAERGSNWVKSVKSVYETGDVIVCFTEQYTGLLHRALSQVLESNLKATVYILSGLTPPKFKSNRVMEASTWLGLIGIIVGFGLLQANIIQLQEGWFQSLLLILSTFCEFWLIGVWNGRAG